MKIGHVIRTERVRQEMKQIVLAKGICTPSYLSKIERNLITPSEEIVDLLLKRLGIDYAALQKSVTDKTDQEFMQFLKNVYRDVVVKKNPKFTKSQLERLTAQQINMKNPSIYYSYQLVLIQLRLVLGGDLKELKVELDVLEEYFSHFDDWQQYMFYLNHFTFYSAISNNRTALKYLEMIRDMLPTLQLEPWALNEFYFKLGVAYAKLSMVSQALEYIERAMVYFREQLDTRRILDCYIMFGIIHKKSHRYQMSLESYQKALEISEEFNWQSESGIIYHNIGTSYSIMGKSDQAIHYYLKSMKEPSISEKPLITIYCLAQEYSKLDNSERVLHWAHKGLQMYHNEPKENMKAYYHHLQFFASYHSPDGLSMDTAKEVIGYFEEIQDFKNIQKYYTALGEWFFKSKKYKLSATFFKEANLYSYNYQKINCWEDL